MHTHELNRHTADGVNKGHGEPVAGHSAQAGCDGVSGSSLEHLVVDCDCAGSAAVVLGPVGRDLRKEHSFIICWRIPKTD